MTLIEKVAYIKGMIEMADLEESKENKLIKAIVDVLDDMALSIEDLEDGAAELAEQIDAVDEDLANLEEDFYDEDEDVCDDDEDDDFYEMECPACHDTIYIDEDMLDEGGIQCPNCGTDLEFDFECDCEDCDHDKADEEDEAE